MQMQIGPTETLTRLDNGKIVLRFKTNNGYRDYGPADPIGNPPGRAAIRVASWAHRPGRTKAEIDFAGEFCAQDPAGPQV
jgi:hypothetical protein